MKPNNSKLDKIYLKMYLAYLDGKGCKLTIHDVETLYSNFGNLWDELLESHEKEKMKELM